jgi:hypothetical protein
VIYIYNSKFAKADLIIFFVKAVKAGISDPLFYARLCEVSLSKICLDDNIDLYNKKELNESSDDGTK